MSFGDYRKPRIVEGYQIFEISNEHDFQSCHKSSLKRVMTCDGDDNQKCFKKKILDRVRFCEMDGEMPSTSRMMSMDFARPPVSQDNNPSRRPKVQIVNPFPNSFANLPKPIPSHPRYSNVLSDGEAGQQQN